MIYITYEVVIRVLYRSLRKAATIQGINFQIVLHSYFGGLSLKG